MTTARMDLFDWFLLLFVYLKLTHQIDWNWKTVLLPAPIALLFYILDLSLPKPKRRDDSPDQ
jgi:hypothetical protein